MGSKEIWNLGYGESFAFIGIHGEKNYSNESRGIKAEDDAQVTQIFQVEPDLSSHKMNDP